jgi:two-component system, OmpR family, sensor kinase
MSEPTPTPASASTPTTALAPKAAPASAPTGPSESRPISPLGPGTLGRKLVARVVALVAVVAILLSAATTFTVRQILMANVQRDLYSSAQVLNRGLGVREYRGNPFGPGQPVGTFAVGFRTGVATPFLNAKVDGRGPGDIGSVPDVTYEILGRIAGDGKQQSLTLPGLGRYRVVGYRFSSRPDEEPEGTIVIGMPLAEVDHTLWLLMGAEAGLALLAMGASVIIVRTLVVRSLRPLNRLAATAQQVSRLELGSGEVALAVRVPPEDTDPTSEVGRVGLAVNHMLNNVESALAARQASETKVRQFVADASHELRNPLAAIRGYAELTRRSGEAIPPDATYAIGRVESEAARMSMLVEDLLLLARLDAGPALDIRPTDLTELVLNAVSDARVAGKEHVWSMSLPDEPVVVLGDGHRLYQVVVNLLANARTHTPPGSRVQAALSAADGRAVISVTDDGPGVPPELQSHVFERFTRADTSRVRAASGPQGGSTGLGLAIVSAVVEAHHGHVDLESRPGHTCFTVTLPLAPADQEPTAAS